MINSYNWYERIRLVYGAIVVLFFLLNLDQYFNSAWGMFAPKFWIIGFFIGSVFIFASRFGDRGFLGKPVLWWSFGYLFLSLLWYIFSPNPNGASDGLMFVFTTFIFVVMALVIYPSMDKFGMFWGGILWIVLALSVIANIWEFASPIANPFFIPEVSIVGRSAGFFMNANISAQALLMFLLCIVARNNAAESIAAMVITFVGLFLTFSRAGMIAYFIIVYIFMYQRNVSRWFIIISLLAFSLLFFGADVIYSLLVMLLDIDDASVLQRIDFIFGKASLDEFSDQSRSEVFKDALAQFVDAPFVGNGLGYMNSMDVGTHNMVLRHMIEYGIVGLFIFPFFILASLRSRSVGISSNGLIFSAGVVFFWSMFSHNMLEQPSFIFTWLALCIVTSSRILEKRKLK